MDFDDVIAGQPEVAFNYQRDFLEALEIVDVLEFIVDALNQEGSSELKDSVLKTISFSPGSCPHFFISDDFDSSKNYYICIKFNDCSDYLINIYFENGSIFMKKYLNNNQEEIYLNYCITPISLQIMNFLMSKYS